MSVNKRLLIACTNQFGYHLDTWYYCKYLKEFYDITYICWDFGKPKVESNGVKVVYLERSEPKPIRLIKFIKEITSRAEQFDFIFIKYFAGCSLVNFSRARRRICLDIRTASVLESNYKRALQDCALKIESKLFRNITVVSDGLKKLLKLPESTMVLPLGAEKIGSGKHEFSEQLELIYVGTFTGRRIEDTVLGLSIFLKNNPKAKVVYHIVGSGWNYELKMLEEIIAQECLSDSVILHGYVHHSDLGAIFDQCNVGVSYVPMTKYYEYQPVTKTFEYIVSGLPVIATATYENRSVVTYEFGEIISDTPVDFARGLSALYVRIKAGEFNCRLSSNDDYTWKNIVDVLRRYIDKKVYA